MQRKLVKLILVSTIALVSIGYAQAGDLPKKTTNFQGNYQTLTKDRKVDDQLAQCIATGHDLIAKDKDLDRLGFTNENLAATKRSKTQKKNPATNIKVQGEARSRALGKWSPVELSCDFKQGKISGIKLSKLNPN